MAFCPLDYRYGCQDFKQIWSEDGRHERQLEVERALVWAHQQMGRVTAEDYVVIERIAVPDDGICQNHGSPRQKGDERKREYKRQVTYHIYRLPHDCDADIVQGGLTSHLPHELNAAPSSGENRQGNHSKGNVKQQITEFPQDFKMKSDAPKKRSLALSWNP